MSRRISVAHPDGGRLVAEESIDGTGLVISGPTPESGRTFVAYAGGVWELDRNGELGRQTVGTLDERAPRTPSAIRRYLTRMVES